MFPSTLKFLLCSKLFHSEFVSEDLICLWYVNYFIWREKKNMNWINIFYFLLKNVFIVLKIGCKWVYVIDISLHCILYYRKWKFNTADISNHCIQVFATSHLFRTKNMLMIISIYQLIDKNINWFKFS